MGLRLWFVDSAFDEAHAYIASTRARDTAKDINLGTGDWQWREPQMETTLWFVDNTRQIMVDVHT